MPEVPAEPTPVSPVTKHSGGFRKAMFEPRWQILGLLFFAGMLNYADRSIFSIVLSPIKTEFSLTDLQIGLLSSLFLWSYALACPLAGILADRFSRCMLVVVSLGGWSLVTALTGASNGLMMLAALRIALGVGESLYLPAAIALLADLHGPATRARALSFHSVGLNMGVILGGTAAGYLAEHFGWRSGFWVFGGAGVALAVFGHFFFARHPAAAAAPVQRPSIREVMGYLIKTPTFYFLMSKITLSGFTIWIFLSWLPLYFREVFNLNLGAAGFVGTFILQIAFVLGLLAGGWISDVWSSRDPRRRMLMMALCYLAASPCLLIFLLEPGFGAVATSIALFSFLRGMGDASEKPALCEVIPARYRSTALGLLNTVANANGGIGVFLVGFLKGSMTLNAQFASLSIFLFGAGALSLYGWRRFMTGDMNRARAFELSIATPALRA